MYDFGKNCATGKQAETPADVVEQFETEREDINLEEDNFNSGNNMDTNEVQSKNTTSSSITT